ncbi:putative transposase [Candidatus Hakubella thermalkaliphila]|uniref:Putative transposase n=3 Tax=Candidatus Hakubella thermalkaliphila TaxID=2754717 RepID=A0A6V8NJF8_9ACTN|nr:RNA-guided endonuclease TnpB family protein [Candidatus Hakubella thermalkaliphila]GFP20333.1 putative transposase [Candidatus Hakubella thermalkaliphila]GFP30122.1 putative transposase [Candidatus Hakubella thermalkaliphila]
MEGKVKTLSITRRNNRWYVSFVVETEPKLLPKTGKEIGIDMGLQAFLTTSDGQQVEAPKYFRSSERQLAKAQRRLSRRKKGSNRRKKARLLVAKAHERITNQRLDFCHKVTCSLVQRYDGFFAENLNIKGMVRHRYLSKSVSDAAWGMFLSILKSKAENAGRRYREVSPNGTSQRCSGCGETVKKSLSTRIHRCPFCGLLLDRDINAAINIQRLGRSLQGGAATATPLN